MSNEVESDYNMTNFIFVLTHKDVTVPNAVEVFEEVRHTSIEYVGLKDVGLSDEGIKKLVETIKRAGKKCVYEVVRDTEEDCLSSVKLAAQLGVDYITAGRGNVKQTLDLLKGTKIRHIPSIGKLVGPRGTVLKLQGTIDDIVDDAKKAEALGAYGVELACYRYEGDPEQLMKAVKATGIPLLIGGGVNTLSRVRRVVELGAWGFTMGSAVFDKAIVPGRSTRDQVEAVLAAI